MTRLRIGIYGGKLEPEYQWFVTQLAELLARGNWTIVTGGNKDDAATDLAALKGVREATGGGSLEGKFEAWVPSMGLDKAADSRMRAEDGVPVKTLRTPLGRRLSMVRSVHAMVTIGGRAHTETVIEQAIELGIPVLPLPAPRAYLAQRPASDKRDSSTHLYELYPEQVRSGFSCDPAKVFERDQQIDWRPDSSSVKAVARLIESAKVKQCLVLHPYTQSRERVYQDVLEPAISKKMLPIRLKESAGSPHISDEFFSALSRCSAVIADATILNHNVMYEVGVAHGQGHQPLVLRIRGESVRLRGKLPLYLQMRNVVTVPEQEVGTLVEDFLDQRPSPGNRTSSLVPPDD